MARRYTDRIRVSEKDRPYLFLVDPRDTQALSRYDRGRIRVSEKDRPYLFLVDPRATPFPSVARGGTRRYAGAVPL